jgi:hypothetical protein
LWAGGRETTGPHPTDKTKKSVQIRTHVASRVPICLNGAEWAWGPVWQKSQKVRIPAMAGNEQTPLDRRGFLKAAAASTAAATVPAAAQSKDDRMITITKMCHLILRYE